MMHVDVIPHRGRHTLRVYRIEGGDLVTTDTLNLHSAQQRDRFIRRLIEEHGFDQSVVRERFRDLLIAIVDTEEAAPEGSIVEGDYEVSDGGIYVRGLHGQVKLTNFVVHIVEEKTINDGVESAKRFVVEGRIGDDPLPRVELTPEDLEDGRWVLREWGSRAIVSAIPRAAAHLRAAIQHLSPRREHRLVFAHIGWRDHGGRWIYLHAGGAIGAAGAVDGVETLLPSALDNYALPAPPQGAERVTAVRASLEVLSVGAEHIMAPLLAMTYRAVLGGSDFSLYLGGETGVFKSELAALLQQHFGALMTARHLPANWSSTANFLEVLAFAAKDAVIVIDDFCPAGSPVDMQRLHREADRIFRSQGNHAGRQRLRSDLSTRPSKPPRGIILATGETAPNGTSVNARLLLLRVSPGDVSRRLLSRLQRLARAGVFAAAMAAFLQWLAADLQSHIDQVRRRAEELRDGAAIAGVHRRTPGIAAELIAAIELFLGFALAVETINRIEHDHLLGRFVAGIWQAAGSQRDEQQTIRPVERFLSLLRSAVDSGLARLDSVPTRPRQSVVGSESAASRIGFIDGTQVWLDLQAAFSMAQSIATRQCAPIGISVHDIPRQMFDAGLSIREASQGGYQVRRTLANGQRRLYLALRLGVWGDVLAETGGSEANSGIRELVEDASQGRPLPSEPQS